MSNETEAVGSTRINLELEVHEIYKELAERSGESIENAPFILMKDVFMKVPLNFKGWTRELALPVNNICF